MRGLWLALRNEDPFSRFAAAGLTLMFGVQSWINMAVNLRAMPAKGMTLPFISYGGSSLLALGLGMGFLIALTRNGRSPISQRHAGGGVVNAAAVDSARRRAAPAAICFPPPRWRSRWRARGVEVELATDDARAANTAAIFPPARSTPFPRRRRPARGSLSKARAALVLGARPRRRAGADPRDCGRAPSSASAAIPTVPPLLAASLLGVPSVLHEQNAVIGRANQLPRPPRDPASRPAFPI